MCLKSSNSSNTVAILFMTAVLNLTWLHKIHSTPISGASLIREALVQVPFGETVTLLCESNDDDHSFIYWYLNEREIVIGPGNSYDNGKFRYEVLSGNLTVKAVSKEEEGVYNCVSRGVTTDDVNIRSVRMVVKADYEEVVYKEDANVNLFRAVVVLGSLMVLSGVGYAGYRIWKTRYRYPTYLIPSDDDEDSAEELFRTPGASRSNENIVKTNSTDSFETPGISTDFRSILDTANNK